MTSFEDYLLASVKRKAAEVHYNHAASALELAQVKERLAQIKSEDGQLTKILYSKLSERDRMYAAAYFVVVGRSWVPTE
jgi:hypothetical protein